jgi:mono/diheme cytochrome c family protein
MRVRDRRWLIVTAALAAACGGDRGAQSGAARETTSAATPAAAAPSADGRAVFARTCQTCHQVNGMGLAPSFPPLAGSEVVTGEKTRLIRIALHGLMGPITVGGKRFNNVMPPWKALSDADMAAVLTFVRSNFGNTGSAVTPEEVAAERAATASRTQPWAPGDLGLH